MNPLLLLKVHRGSATVLALLALSATLLVCALPRAFERTYDSALNGVLTGTGATLTDITVAYRPRSDREQLGTVEPFQVGDRHFRRTLPPAVAAVLDHRPGDRSHFAAKTTGTPVADRVGPGHRPLQYVDLAWLSDVDRRIRYVAGSPPGAPSTVAHVPGHPTFRDITLFPIALSKRASEQMDIPIGTTLVLGNSRPSLAR
ncbi:hypothetical protein, partial [Sphaerisporangium perillae]|uniref:hypothetical protein n=1 Tax=Sphaerisporangium perillae TaxID=2935860 RepID=UPI00200D38E1